MQEVSQSQGQRCWYPSVPCGGIELVGSGLLRVFSCSVVEL